MLINTTLTTPLNCDMNTSKCGMLLKHSSILYIHICMYSLSGRTKLIQDELQETKL